MKRILFLLLALSLGFGAYSQETKAELLTRFDVIRNETVAGANTKTRIANAYQELSDASQGIYYIVASGTDTYTTSLLNLDAYAGKYFVVQFTNANTGSSTLNINSLGAITIKKDGTTNLAADDIDALDVHILAYDGTNFQVLTMGGAGGGGGSGTVTSVSVTTANGVSGSVANATTTPAISLTLGAITPTSIGSATTATTQSAGTNNTTIATTAYADAKVADAITNGVTAIAPSQNAVFDALAIRLLDRATPSTAGGTITLDMNSQTQRMHVGSASFATPKTVALSNTTNSLVFSFSFTVSNVAAVLTMPSDFVMSELTWDGSAWTPPATGNFEMGGSFDGTNWIVKMAGPFN